MFLRELKKPVHQLHGIGAAGKKDLASLGVLTIADLLLHIPRDYEDRLEEIPLASVMHSPHEFTRVNTVVRVIEHTYFGWGKKRTLKVTVQDDTSPAALVCFGRNFLARLLTPGKEFFLYGSFTYRYGEIQSSSFDVEPVSEHPKNFGKILPIYPLSGKLTQYTLRRAVSQALSEYAHYIESELPIPVLEQYELVPKAKALSELHFPSSRKQMQQGLYTLKFEELFYFQLIMLLRMQKRKHKNRSQGKHSTILQQQLIQRLPFTLTADQDHVLEEINQDLQQPVVMTRLLQGDVGSGKTLVAFLAALPCIEAGHQVAFMAPTELLAQQHAENAAIFLEPLGIRIAILTGTLRSEQRGLLLDSLARGEIDIAMGTHALFSSDVTFHSLGLVIVDEQHRFGVVQRLSLVEKGDLPDLLLMTATPIPRTMALTVFGDLDISTIKTLPPGRKPVETHLAREGNEEKVYRWIEKEIRKGRQAYFVYPLIRQSDKMELKNAEDMFHDLDTNIFPEFSLGLIHSQLPEQEKEETMGKFVSGSLDILVSTSVVEVGVDVPNATCMVIEHAERFGLAALHQLRGRVGRSSYQSYAFLVFSESLTETGKKRLMVMKECNDGFVIAEEDLKMRGPGEITGTRQSGDYGFRIADPAADETILLQAREEARNRLQEDRALSTPDNKVIRRVLTQCPPFSYHYLDSG